MTAFFVIEDSDLICFSPGLLEAELDLSQAVEDAMDARSEY